MHTVVGETVYFSACVPVDETIYYCSRPLLTGEVQVIFTVPREQQGFNALESMLHYLLYGTPDSNMRELLPIDVVLRENIS